MRRVIAFAVTDLPDPDSPTIASVRPGWTSKLRSLTAMSGPWAVGNATDRDRTLRSGSLTKVGEEPGIRASPPRERPAHNIRKGREAALRWRRAFLAEPPRPWSC